MRPRHSISRLADSAQIAGAIHPRRAAGKRVGYKFFRRKLRAVQIAARKSVTGNV